MALPDFFKIEPGTAKTIKSSGGDAAITCTSLASGSARESTKLDLGAIFARRWKVTFETKLNAAGTNGTEIELYTNESSSSAAGTDNNGGATGTDAAFSNSSELKHQWAAVGSLAVSNAAGTNLQRQSFYYTPVSRYQSMLVVNNSGVAFSGTATDTIITWTPCEEGIEDTA